MKYVTTTDKFFEDADLQASSVLKLMKSKNHDYSAGQGPFANFQMSESLGVEPEIGLMIRMMDKMQRVRTYLEQGSLKVPGEGVVDAANDLLGYSLLLGGMIRERVKSQLPAKITGFTYDFTQGKSRD